MCEVCPGLSLEGLGVPRAGPNLVFCGCSRVLWPATADPSRAALTFPQPKRYPACLKLIFKQVPSGRLRAGAALGTVGGGC